MPLPLSDVGESFHRKGFQNVSTEQFFEDPGEGNDLPLDDTRLVSIPIHIIKLEQCRFDLEHAVIHALRDIVLFSCLAFNSMSIELLKRLTKHHGRIRNLSSFTRWRCWLLRR